MVLRRVTSVVTERCNLRCATCYTRDRGTPMSLDTALAALALLLGRPGLSAPAGATLQWAFTGGEPLLAGEAWYAAVLAGGARLAAQAGREVEWSIQSNLLALDAALEALLRRHDVRLGTSIDGPPELQQRHRPGAAGTVEVFWRLAARGRPPGVTCAVSAESWRRRDELVRYFAQLSPPVLRLQALRPLGPDRDLRPPTGEELFEVRRAFAQTLLNGRWAFLDPDLLLQLSYFFEGRPAGIDDCTALRCGAGRSAVSVDTDGTIYPCILPARAPQPAIGDVRRGLAHDIAARVARFHGSQAWSVRCFDCRARRICFFGCRAVALATGEPRGPDPECSATRLQWDALCADPSRARSLYEHQRALCRHLAGDRARSSFNHVYVPESRYQ